MISKPITSHPRSAAEPRPGYSHPEGTAGWCRLSKDLAHEGWEWSEKLAGDIPGNDYLPPDALPRELLGPEAGDLCEALFTEGWRKIELGPGWTPERWTLARTADGEDWPNRNWDIIGEKPTAYRPIAGETTVNGVLWRDPAKWEPDVAPEPAAPEMPRVDPIHPIHPITVRLTVAEARRILATRITAARALDASIAELETALNAAERARKGGEKI